MKLSNEERVQLVPAVGEELKVVKVTDVVDKFFKSTVVTLEAADGTRYKLELSLL